MVVVLWGCKPYSYFSTGNDLLQQNCSVFLINGDTTGGLLTVQFESGYIPQKFVSLKTYAGQARKIPIDSISYFRYQSDYYVPKEINLEAYTLPNKDYFYDPSQRNLLFVRRLTAEGSRLHLFELVQKRTRTHDGKDHFSYFLSKASEHRYNAWSIGGSKFLPDFDEKMSAYLFDCPALSDKIRKKARGYSLGQVSFDAKKLEIFKKIVNEYNECIHQE